MPQFFDNIPKEELEQALTGDGLCKPAAKTLTIPLEVISEINTYWRTYMPDCAEDECYIWLLQQGLQASIADEQPSNSQ